MSWTSVANIKGPAGAVSGRITTGLTTSSLANNAHQETTVTALGKSYLLFSIHTNKAARVRLYSTTAARDADASRAVGVDPGAGSGLILELITAGSIAYPLSPMVLGADLTGQTVGSSGSPVSNAAVSITNLSGSTGTVTVTFVSITLEA